jgi:hypothetical protein
LQLQAFQLIATITAILTVIRFQRRLKGYMVGRHALPKLISFKLFVFVTTIQHVSLGTHAERSMGGKLIILRTVHLQHHLLARQGQLQSDL